MQAQTLQRRFAEAEVQWRRIDDLVAAHRLPERVGEAMFDALIGARVQRPSYMKRADVEGRTATRDLVRLSELGILDPVGKTRARYYMAGPVLREVHLDLASRRTPLADPYPMDEGRAGGAAGARGAVCRARSAPNSVLLALTG